jgi:hypothetical protein
MAIAMFVAIELDEGFIKSYRKKQAEEFFFNYESDGYWNMELPSRFLGTKLDKSKVIKKIWLAKPDALPSPVKSAKVFRLARGNGVMLLELEFEAHQVDDVVRFRKLSSPQLRKILRGFDLESALDVRNAIYPVIGSIVPESDEWTPAIKDGWAHVQGGHVEKVLLEQIIARVAIEKSFLSWLIRSDKRFRSPVGLWLIRHWPVQLLTDWRDVSDQYSLLRESLNLPAVRAELIDNGKSWWNSVTATLGVLALIAALVGIYL